MYQTFYISGKLRKDLILFMNNEVFTQTKKYFSRLGLAYFFGSLIIIAGQTAVTGVCAVIDPSMALLCDYDALNVSDFHTDYGISDL